MKKEFLATIQELAKKGKNAKEIADIIGTYRQRVEYYLRTYPLSDLQNNGKKSNIK